MTSSHEILPHTSEVAVQLQADSLAHLLEEAARALAELETGGGPRESLSAWMEVTVTARDREALLVHWLNELLYMIETARIVPTEFRIDEVSDMRAHAWVRGPHLDHPPVTIKAATYHGLTIRDRGGGLDAQVLFDV